MRFLNVLSGFIPSEQRIITIEDSAELQLQGLPNLVRLETRNGSEDGCREIGIRELIRSSLRMRPDRIIVGEVRGAEAIDMLQCMNTGHDGLATYLPNFQEEKNKNDNNRIECCARKAAYADACSRKRNRVHGVYKL